MLPASVMVGTNECSGIAANRAWSVMVHWRASSRGSTENRSVAAETGSRSKL